MSNKHVLLATLLPVISIVGLFFLAIKIAQNPAAFSAPSNCEGVCRYLQEKGMDVSSVDASESDVMWDIGNHPAIFVTQNNHQRTDPFGLGIDFSGLVDLSSGAVLVIEYPNAAMARNKADRENNFTMVPDYATTWGRYAIYGDPVMMKQIKKILGKQERKKK